MVIFSPPSSPPPDAPYPPNFMFFSFLSKKEINKKLKSKPILKFNKKTKSAHAGAHIAPLHRNQTWSLFYVEQLLLSMWPAWSVVDIPSDTLLKKKLIYAFPAATNWFLD